MAEQDGFDLGSIWDYTKSAGSAVGDAISTHSGLLSSIGGALGAHATGGQQGLNTFMAAVAQRDQQQLADSFKREMFDREKAFTLRRDKLQQEHDKAMLDKRAETEGAANLEESINAVAGILGADPNGATNMLTEMKSMGLPVDPNMDWAALDFGAQRDLIKQFVKLRPKGGVDVLQQQQSSQEIREQNWAQLGIGPLPDGVNAQNWPTIFAQAQQHGLFVGERLNGVNTKVNNFSSEINDASKLTPSDRLAKLQLLQRSLGGLATDLGTLENPTYAPFTAGPNSGQYGATQLSVKTLNDRVASEILSTQRAIAGTFDFSRDDATNFNAIAISPNKEAFAENLQAVQPQIESADNAMTKLMSLPPDIASSLFAGQPQVQALIEELTTAQADGTPYTFETKLRSLWEAVRDEDTDAQAKLNNLIKTAANLNPASFLKEAAEKVHAEDQRYALTTELSAMDRQLGFALGLDDNIIDGLLTSYGRKETVPGDPRFTDLPFTGHVFDDEARQKMMSDPTIVANIANNLYTQFEDDDNPLDTALMRASQLTGKPLTAAAAQLVQDELTTRHGISAGFTSAGAARELHGYAPSPWVSTTGSINETFSSDQIAAHNDANWNSYLVGTTPQLSAVSRSVSRFKSIAESERPGFEQPRGKAPVEYAMTFEAEAEGATNVSLYDLMAFGQDVSPDIARLLSGSGRIGGAGQAYKHYPAVGGRGGTATMAHDVNKSWTQSRDGETMRYVNGDLSLAKSLGNAGASDDTINRAGLIDAIRGIDFVTNPPRTDGDRVVLESVQAVLRAMPNDEIHKRFLDPNTPPDEMGLPMEEFDLNYQTGDTRVTGGTYTDSLLTPEVIEAEDSRLRAAIRKTSTAVQYASETPNVVFDTDPGVGVDLMVGDTHLLEQELVDLENQATTLEVRKLAIRNKGVHDNLSKGLAQLIYNEGTGITSIEDLSTAVTTNIDAALGRTTDALALETSPAVGRLSTLLTAGTSVRQGFSSLLSVSGEFASKKLQEEARQSNMSISERTPFAEIANAGLADTLGAVDDLADRLADGNISRDNVAPEIAQFLPLSWGTAKDGEGQYADAITLWAAGQQSRGIN